MFSYIERFYNPARRHSTLRYFSPAAFEQARKAYAGVYGTGSRPEPMTYVEYVTWYRNQNFAPAQAKEA
jgi:hypothetical protein